MLLLYTYFGLRTMSFEVTPTQNRANSLGSSDDWFHALHLSMILVLMVVFPTAQHLGFFDAPSRLVGNGLRARRKTGFSGLFCPPIPAPRSRE